MGNEISSNPSFAEGDSYTPRKVSEEDLSEKIEGWDENPEEEKEAPQPEDEGGEERETETPSEPPAEEKPDKPEEDQPESREVEGLSKQKEQLLEEIRDLRQRRRTLREKPDQTSRREDDLKDINEQDVKVIDRVLRAKGYVKQEEMQKATYEMTKQEELERFLKEYPEYKPENDPKDVLWSALREELQYYRDPDDPRTYRDILRRAHRNLPKPSSQPAAAKRERARAASTGASQTYRSAHTSNRTPMTADKRAMLRRGGWSEKEIDEMERNL